MKSITLIEELIPKLKYKSEFDTTPDWLNYVIDTIEDALAQSDDVRFVDANVSPVHKIRNIFKNNKPLAI
jgi:hypothetical protein